MPARHGWGARVATVVGALPQVDRAEASTETSCDEVIMSVAHGAAAISPVAVALAEAGITVEGLTLRTPTLDDVFLHMTGGRMQEEQT